MRSQWTTTWQSSCKINNHCSSIIHMAANIEQANALIQELREMVASLQQQLRIKQQEIEHLNEELNLQHDKYYDV